MKKIISAVLVLMILLTSSLMVDASEVVTEISEESVSLVDKGMVSFSNVTFSQTNYISTGYVTLNMGYSTTYTVNLSNVIQYFDYYSHSNVANVYLQFDLGSVYTGYTDAQQQWLSSNMFWDKDSKRLSLGTSIPASATIEIWWNLVGQSGGAPSTAPGGIRLYSINLVVEYANPIGLYTELTSFEQLPEGNNLFNSYQDLYAIPASEEVADAIIQEAGNGLHNIYLELESGNYLVKNVTLPEPLRQRNPPSVNYFATKDYKFIQFFTNSKPNAIERDYLLWNLTTGEYNMITSGIIYGYPRVGGNGLTNYNMMYVDYAVPWEIDKVISIQIELTYRYHYIWRSYGEDITEVRTLFNGAYTNIAMPWWTKYMGLYQFALSSIQENARFLALNQIKDVTSSYDTTKKAQFVSFLNANNKQGITFTMEQVFPYDVTIAQVFIGQFDKLWSDGVEPVGLVLMEMRWETSGVEYALPYPDNITPTPPPVFPGDPVGAPDPLTLLLEAIWKFIRSLWPIAVAFISFAMMYYGFKWFVPKKYRYNLIIRAIVLAGIFIVIYYGYTP